MPGSVSAGSSGPQRAGRSPHLLAESLDLLDERFGALLHLIRPDVSPQRVAPGSKLELAQLRAEAVKSKTFDRP